MKLAAATGNISAVMHLLAKTASLTPADYVKKTVGSVMFTYYTYVDKYHVHPRDLDDLIDGLLFIEAKNYIVKQAREEARQQAQSQRK